MGGRNVVGKPELRWAQLTLLTLMRPIVHGMAQTGMQHHEYPVAEALQALAAMDCVGMG